MTDTLDITFDFVTYLNEPMTGHLFLSRGDIVFEKRIHRYLLWEGIPEHIQMSALRHLGFPANNETLSKLEEFLKPNLKEARDLLPSPSISWQSYGLPAMDAMVTCPCSKRVCAFFGFEQPVRETIIFLNDSVQWTREQIADWLDGLHDSGVINIEFEPWEEENEQD